MKNLFYGMLVSLVAVSSHAASYTVKSGETMLGIANRNCVSVSELAKVNGIKDPMTYNVKIGQRLTIPKCDCKAKDTTLNEIETDERYHALEKKYAKKTVTVGKYYKYVTPTKKTEILVIEK